MIVLQPTNRHYIFRFIGGDCAPMKLILLAFILSVRILSAQPVSKGSTVVIIDRNVRNLEVLLCEVKPGAKVVFYDNSREILPFIHSAILLHKPVSSLHIVSHGKQGKLLLSKKELTGEMIEQSEVLLGAWKECFAPGGDILIYGCEVGKGSEGLEFIKSFAVRTGIDIAASKNDTGSALEGGDWAFELCSGKIESTYVFSRKAREEYPTLLK